MSSSESKQAESFHREGCKYEKIMYKLDSTYWDMYPNYPEIIEVKKNFKKTLFGWKRV